jgi:DNA (cytosine-5)-methyltransferase 1
MAVEESLTMRSIELFTGCGGLAMGLSRAGFLAERMVEWDRHSVMNVLHNKERRVQHVADWPIIKSDVRHMVWETLSGLDLVAGGPPCQPFSIGGRHRGHEDARDMWPEAVRAVRETMPRSFIFENVRGLMRDAFSDYLRWVRLSLAAPHICQRDGETRADHLARLEHQLEDAEYRVSVTQVNAADFGAAQKRHRVIILGIRKDVADNPPALVPTHSMEALVWEKWVSGEYWRRHGINPPQDGPDKSEVATLRKLDNNGIKPSSLPWRTVRDAIAGLGEPGMGSASNHIPQPGARSYPGHTGSPIDMPAKALKAGVHGVPGGENTMMLPNGGIRYFTVREAARLQGMPDDFEFVGSWSENMRQLGNAVPSQLAEAAGRVIATNLTANKEDNSQRHGTSEEADKAQAA